MKQVLFIQLAIVLLGTQTSYGEDLSGHVVTSTTQTNKSEIDPLKGVTSCFDYVNELDFTDQIAAKNKQIMRALGTQTAPSAGVDLELEKKLIADELKKCWKRFGPELVGVNRLKALRHLATHFKYATAATYTSDNVAIEIDDSRFNQDLTEAREMLVSTIQQLFNTGDVGEAIDVLHDLALLERINDPFIKDLPIATTAIQNIQRGIEDGDYYPFAGKAGFNDSGDFRVEKSLLMTALSARLASKDPNLYRDKDGRTINSASAIYRVQQTIYWLLTLGRLETAKKGVIVEQADQFIRGYIDLRKAEKTFTLKDLDTLQKYAKTGGGYWTEETSEIWKNLHQDLTKECINALCSSEAKDQ